MRNIEKSLAKHFALGVLVLAVIFLTTTTLFAWTGPSQSAPNGNISAPVNVGSTDQVKNAGLSLNALAVFGNAILSGVSRYLNFGTTAGSSGYGIRDNAGVMEVKSNGGSWTPIGTASGQTPWLVSGTDVYYNGGDVGIGTASPSQKLDVAGLVRSSTGFCIVGDCRTSWSSVGDNLGNHQLTQNLQTKGFTISRTGGDSGIFIDSSNNVLIKGGINGGNQSYGAPLDVNGEIVALNLSLFGGNNTKLDVMGPTTGTANIYLTPGNSNFYWRLQSYGTSYSDNDYRKSLRLYFYNNGTVNNAFVIDTQGQMGIGISNPANVNYALEVNGNAGKNDGSTVWSNASDERLKDVLGEYTRGLGEILKINPIRYTYKENNARNLPSGEEYVGFVAQQIQKVFPESVTVGEDGYLDFDMHPVNVALINAIKELKAENDRQNAENEALRAQMNELREEIERLKQ